MPVLSQYLGSGSHSSLSVGPHLLQENFLSCVHSQMTASSLRICTVQRGTPSTPHLGFSDSCEFHEQEWGHWVWDVTSLHQVSSGLACLPHRDAPVQPWAASDNVFPPGGPRFLLVPRACLRSAAVICMLGEGRSGLCPAQLCPPAPNPVPGTQSGLLKPSYFNGESG